MNTELSQSFINGMQFASSRTPKNDEKALIAITRRNTNANERAFWTGYICKIQQNIGENEEIPLNFGQK